MIRTLIGLGLAVLAATPAFAAQHDPGYAGGGRGKPGVKLTVSYIPETGAAVAVPLECDPPGGDHPRPKAACAELAAVGGDPAKIEPTRHMACFLIYQPVTVKIAGSWHGTAVDWQHTYGNGCDARRALRSLIPV
jgi:hypothetical protein